MTEPVFLLALGMVGVTTVMVVKSIAAAIGGRKVSSDLTQLREQVDPGETRGR